MSSTTLDSSTLILHLDQETIRGATHLARQQNLDISEWFRRSVKKESIKASAYEKYTRLASSYDRGEEGAVSHSDLDSLRASYQA